MAGFFRNILCPVTLDECSLAALSTARRVARHGLNRESTIYLLHVLPNQLFIGDPEPTYADDDYRIAQVRRALGEAARKRLQYVRYQILIDRAYHRLRAVAVIETASKVRADLIVMATHGRTGLSHWMHGGFAEKIIRDAPCPVLTVGPGAAAQSARLRHEILRIPSPSDVGGGLPHRH